MKKKTGGDKKFLDVLVEPVSISTIGTEPRKCGIKTLLCDYLVKVPKKQFENVSFCNISKTRIRLT